jgi:hypothetical protein
MGCLDICLTWPLCPRQANDKEHGRADGDAVSQPVKLDNGTSVSAVRKVYVQGGAYFNPPGSVSPTLSARSAIHVVGAGR